MIICRRQWKNIWRKLDRLPIHELIAIPVETQLCGDHRASIIVIDGSRYLSSTLQANSYIGCVAAFYAYSRQHIFHSIPLANNIDVRIQFPPCELHQGIKITPQSRQYYVFARYEVSNREFTIQICCRKHSITSS